MHSVSKRYDSIDDSRLKLVHRANHQERTLIQIGNHTIGGSNITIMAGPCSVESLHQLMTIAQAVKEYGSHVLRGGAYKPRTSPYDFQGLKEEGLHYLQEVSVVTGLPIVTEVVSPEVLDKVLETADILQIGSRNMHNYELLKAVGKTNKPVLLKRGFAATIEEWLLAAEYIMAAGNDKVILCERGIRTFETYTRNTLDLSAVAALKQLTHLPVIVDPSHATGRRDLVIPMALAALAAGADGIMVEVHHDPDVALSDGGQALTIDMFKQLIDQIKKMAPFLGRTLPF